MLEMPIFHQRKCTDGKYAYETLPVSNVIGKMQTKTETPLPLVRKVI